MTERHVSLLRGINVGGHNLVSMARLRALYEALDCEDVATYSRAATSSSAALATLPASVAASSARSSGSSASISGCSTGRTPT